MHDLTCHVRPLLRFVFFCLIVSLSLIVSLFLIRLKSLLPPPPLQLLTPEGTGVLAYLDTDRWTGNKVQRLTLPLYSTLYPLLPKRILLFELFMVFFLFL